MERIETDNDFYPISVFALAVPMALSVISLLLLCFHLATNHFKFVDRHSKYQKELDVKQVKYVQSRHWDMHLAVASNESANTNFAPAKKPSNKKVLPVSSQPTGKQTSTPKLAKGDVSKAVSGAKFSSFFGANVATQKAEENPTKVSSSKQAGGSKVAVKSSKSKNKK